MYTVEIPKDMPLSQVNEMFSMILKGQVEGTRVKISKPKKVTFTYTPRGAIINTESGEIKVVCDKENAVTINNSITFTFPYKIEPSVDADFNVFIDFSNGNGNSS